MKQIYVGKGLYTVVDDVDAILALDCWNCDNRSYARRTSINCGKSSSIYLHVEIFKLKSKMVEIPPDYEVDHEDRNRLNNCRSNLRLATRSQQLQNASQRTNSKAPYKGISYNRKRDKWEAYIQKNRRRQFLGYFETAEAARTAYNQAAFKHFGGFANVT